MEQPSRLAGSGGFLNQAGFLPQGAKPAFLFWTFAVRQPGAPSGTARRIFPFIIKKFQFILCAKWRTGRVTFPRRTAPTCKHLMSLHRFHNHFGGLLAAWIAVTGLMAAEHHGTVKFGGLPVPGAAVTATKGDQKLATTTDENGRYAFADLSDGAWTIEIEMLGFAKLSNDVGIAFDAPAAEWNLKFLPMSAIMAPPAAPAPKPAADAPATPAASPAVTSATAPVTAAAVPATTTQTAAAAAPKAAANGNPSRGQQANAARGAQGGRGQNGANGGRPSLLAADGYQRVDVNSSSDLAAAPDTGLAANEVADLSNSADPSLLVSGSVSRGLDMPQGNDWFGGPGGRMDGMAGGPGGINGMNLAGGDSGAMGGGGGQGSGRGGMAGGGGMPGGGFA